MKESETRPDLRLDDPTLYDRLVDDELTDDERRELLRRLDREPGGWRRCALAFLEAQTWNREMKALRDGSPDGGNGGGREARPAPVLDAADSRRWPLGPLATALAMAASFLVALSIGLVLRGGPDSGNLADNADKKAGETQVVDAERERESSADKDEPRQTAPETAPERTGESGGRDTRYVVDERRFAPPGEPVVPEELVRLMRRMGYEIEHDRQLIPVETEQGSPVVVPIDEVQFRYIGNKYQ